MPEIKITENMLHELQELGVVEDVAGIMMIDTREIHKPGRLFFVTKNKGEQ